MKRAAAISLLTLAGFISTVWTKPGKFQGGPSTGRLPHPGRLSYTGPCGVRNPTLGEGGFVFGGQQATLGSWPWQVSMMFRNGTNYNHRCGGILITDQWVLTAAHCVDKGSGGPAVELPSSWKLGLGFVNRSDTASITYRYIDQVTKHHSYSLDLANGNPYDIALLRMNVTVDTSGPNIVPACLPPSGTNFEQRTDCWLSGWGYTDNNPSMSQVLMEARMDIQSNAECEFLTDTPIAASHVCGYDPSAAGCNGDSGGPLSCPLNGTWTAAGIISWGAENCQETPTVCTRVSKYIDWIQDITNSRFYK